MKVNLIFILLLLNSMSFAQSRSGTEDIENLFSQESQSAIVAPAATPIPSSGSSANPTVAPSVNPNAMTKTPDAATKTITDLQKLTPFGDVAVIQRRYMPRSGRFQIFVGFTNIMNDAFFTAMGANARISYYFVERWGIEGGYSFLSTAQRQTTEDLRTKRFVDTTSIVTPNSVWHVDLKWAPIYGKMTHKNRDIIYFDLYFSGGFGMTTTNQNQSEPTLHLGTGQEFSINKSWAFRWDFSWNTFLGRDSAGRSTQSSLYNNLYLTLGVSLFFPEAKGR